ncbi:MAG: hypothetical protein LBV60_15255, partial [Streptomyces sp.]|nr:hypothetical protein [Streptomyces sp.]
STFTQPLEVNGCSPAAQPGAALRPHRRMHNVVRTSAISGGRSSPDESATSSRPLSPGQASVIPGTCSRSSGRG